MGKRGEMFLPCLGERDVLRKDRLVDMIMRLIWHLIDIEEPSLDLSRRSLEWRWMECGNMGAEWDC